MEAAVRAKVFAPGTLLELTEEVIKYPDGSAPHHKRGVKLPVFPNGPQVLPDLYALPAMRGLSQQTFLVSDGRRLTFAETLDEAAALGHALVHTLGVKRGDRVCILSRNRIEYVVALLATTSIGGVAVPMNSWWKTQEIEYGVGNSESKVVIVDRKRFAHLAPVLDKLPCVDKVLLLSPLSDDKRINEGAAVPQHSKLADYDAIVGAARGNPMPDCTAEKDDNALIMYTSGTTGHPKGVVLTHRGMTFAMTSLIAHIALTGALEAIAKGETPQPPGSKAADPNATQNSILLTVPLFHATGLHAILLASFLSGRKIVMMPKWDPLGALELIERERVTSFTGVPTMVLQLMQHPRFKDFDTSSLESVGGGGAPPPPSMVKDVGTNFKKAAPGQGYGMTETNALVCITGAAAYATRPTSCGRPLPGVTVQIWSDDGELLEAGQRGRVMVRGANLMKEYWRKPEATQKTFFGDGFLDTGDVGMLDEDGYLHLGGRTKELIIRAGENISCAAVENAVYDCKDVAECAAIGVPHPVLGEEVGVVVFPKPGAAKRLTLEALRAVCAHLAGFEQPTHLYLWPQELPRGATGKIVKREIMEKIKSENILSEQQKQQSSASKM